MGSSLLLGYDVFIIPELCTIFLTHSQVAGEAGARAHAK
jgi:hypothetical protein